MILGFKPQFVDKILSGTKIHSIREDKNRRWKTGMKIHFATGVRTKNYKQFREGRCWNVQTITMDFRVYPVPFLVDGKLLSMVDKMRLVEYDGFDKYMDLFNFFGEPFDYFFSGVIIHWTPYRYHDKRGFAYNESSLVNEITANKNMIVANLVQNQININKQKEIETVNKLPENPKENVYWSRFSKKVTREDLKRIREKLRASSIPMKKERKAGLFGRLFAWILELIKKIPLILAYSIAGLILMVGVTILILWIMLNKGMIF